MKTVSSFIQDQTRSINECLIIHRIMIDFSINSSDSIEKIVILQEDGMTMDFEEISEKRL